MLSYLLIFILVVTSTEGVCLGSSRNSTCVSIRQRIQEILFFKTVCYSEVGCFYSGPPFYHPIHRPISILPDSPEVIQPKYLLYTRANRNDPIFLETGKVRNLAKSRFNPKAVTRIIAHGYFESVATSHWSMRIKDAILHVGDDNVILLDWSGGAKTTYNQAVANTRVSGTLVANFIKFLCAETGIRPERFHLIGHSLGAHLFGYTGTRVKKIGRISGLDPAGPYFNQMSEEVILDPSDALFVDNIHTDRALLITEGSGIDQDNGDVDFWPWNGKVPKSVCPGRLIETIVEDGLQQVVRQFTYCQHSFSYEIFSFSFNQNNCLFIGVKCRSWEEFIAGLCDCGDYGERCNFMGFFALPPSDQQKADSYRHFLVINVIRPYCVHQYVLNIYVHNIHASNTLINKGAYEDVTANITLIGNENVLQKQITLQIRPRNHIQILSFLLTYEKPLEKVHSALIDFGHHSNFFSGNNLITNEFNITRYSLEKLEITYLFPLPKTETEFTLCKNECSKETCGNRLLFQENVCKTQNAVPGTNR